MKSLLSVFVWIGVGVTLLLSLQNCKKTTDPITPGGGTTNPGSNTTTPGSSTSAATTAPSVNTATGPIASGSTPISATLSAVITGNGGAAISQHGFVYSKTSQTPTLADSKTELGATSGPFPLTITSSLTSLDANTTYYVRAYATNEKGTGYGAVAQVKTSATQTTSKVNGTALFGISAIDADRSDDKFYAVDLETGATKWVFKSGVGFAASADVADGVAYVASGKNLYAVDIATGTAKWTSSATEAFGKPLVVGNVIYLTEGQSYLKLIAIDAARGTKKWELSLATQNSGSQPNPTVVNGIVYVGTGTRLIAADANTGTIKWSYTPDSPMDLSNPAVVDNVLYTSSRSYVYAFDAGTGTRKWFTRISTRIDDWGGSPTVSNGNVYIYSYLGYAMAFDAATGAKKWEYRTDVKGIMAPFVSNGLLYAANAVIDAATGSKKMDLAVPFINSLVVDEHYFAAVSRKLVPINVATGAQKWQSVSLTGNPLPPVIIGNDGKVYRSSDSGAQQ